MSNIMEQGNAKIGFSSVGIIAMALVLVFFGVRPQLVKLSGLQTAIEENRQEFSFLQAKVVSLEQAAAELEKAAGQKKAIFELFPKRDEMERAVLGLEEAAGAAGTSAVLTITDRLEDANASRSGEKKGPAVAGLKGIEEVPFVLDLSGTYRQLVDFFLNFENSPYVTKITGFSVVADVEVSEQREEPRNTGRATGKAEGIFFMRSE